jgi:leader peptidase (prepilin peptidase)/N-methyltransferase
MEYFIVIFMVAVFGVIIGSFLNVVIYRLGSGAGMNGRSKCLSCGKRLTPRMLVPIMSFVLQRGRCAHCGVKVSWQYPLVELATGLLFALVVLHHGAAFSTFVSPALFYVMLDMCIWATLLVIFVYDLKHKIIPDRLALLFALLAGVLLALKYSDGVFPIRYIPIFDTVPWWIDLAAGPLLFVPFALLWFLSAGRAMGLGDAKLAVGIGWFLGFSGGISALVLGFWIAFFPSLALLFLRSKQFTMKSEIPFAPFLVLGTLVVYVFGVDLLRLTF